MARLKFYMSPGTCSTGIHILLEELGLVFEAYPLNLLAGDQFKPEYLAINPRGSVPALMLPDGSALTSYRSIACWLAEAHPHSRLLPEDDEDKVQVMAVVKQVVQTLHREGVVRIFTTATFSDEAVEAAAAPARARPARSAKGPPTGAGRQRRGRGAAGRRTERSGEQEGIVAGKQLLTTQKRQ